MLDELLKHNSIGTKEEIHFVLFNALTSNGQEVRNLKAYCIAHKYSISKSFRGIISLLNYVGFLSLNGNIVKLETSTFDKKDYWKSEGLYFTKPHFYNCLLTSLRADKQMHRLFNSKNVQFKVKENLFFVKSSLIPIRSFPLRNLLLSLEFFKPDQNNPNHLLIGQSYNQLFEKFVINHLNKRTNRKSQITIEKLKEGLKKQEQLGKEAELFILGYEKNRLKDHPFKTKIERIADEFVNAGFDIESFTGLNTLVPNRFIEVKSYSDQVSFYWSRNEVDTAKELGEEYFLYLVDRSKYHLKGYEPMIVKNPYDRIFESEFWKTETENWKITLDK